MRLREDQLTEFRERGYVVVRQLIDAATVRRLSDEIDALHERMAEAPLLGATTVAVVGSGLLGLGVARMIRWRRAPSCRR